MIAFGPPGHSSAAATRTWCWSGNRGEKPLCCGALSRSPSVPRQEHAQALQRAQRARVPGDAEQYERLPLLFLFLSLPRVPAGRHHSVAGGTEGSPPVMAEVRDPCLGGWRGGGSFPSTPQPGRDRALPFLPSFPVFLSLRALRAGWRSRAFCPLAVQPGWASCRAEPQRCCAPPAALSRQAPSPPAQLL